jgi:tetratricopeptide (TPR) repeat protein
VVYARRLHQRVTAAYFGGDYEHALTIAKQALELAKSTFGTRDPRTLTSIDDLASVLEKLQRYEEEEPLLRELLAAKGSITGNRNKDTVGIRQRLADALEKQAHYDEALESLTARNMVRMSQVL